MLIGCQVSGEGGLVDGSLLRMGLNYREKEATNKASLTLLD